MEICTGLKLDCILLLLKKKMKIVVTCKQNDCFNLLFYMLCKNELRKENIDELIKWIF